MPYCNVKTGAGRQFCHNIVSRGQKCHLHREGGGRVLQTLELDATLDIQNNTEIVIDTGEYRGLTLAEYITDRLNQETDDSSHRRKIKAKLTLRIYSVEELT